MSNNYRIRIKKGEIEFEVEGDKEFVKELFEEFETKTENISGSNTENIQSKTGQEEQSIFKKYSISQIYKSMKLKINLDRILFFAYWMLKKDDKKEFSINNTMEYFDQFGLRKPKNPKRDFNKLVSLKRGHLNTGSSDDFYSLSFDGINYIEEKLNKLEIE
ncbi:hypothetical protein ES705_07355 [subsurface metagenome]